MSRSITRSALVKRIRRVLRHWNWRLLTPRCSALKADPELGRYNIIDSNGNLREVHSDLMELARDLGVIRDWEVVDDPEQGHGETSLQAAGAGQAENQKRGMEMSDKQYQERVQALVDLLRCHQRLDPVGAARMLNNMAVALVNQIAKDHPDFCRGNQDW